MNAPTAETILAKAAELVELRYQLLDALEKGDRAASVTLDGIAAAVKEGSETSIKAHRVANLAHLAINSH